MSGAILIVEDDSDVREVLREALELSGRSVVEAENGKVALEVLEHGVDVSLVLLDLRMPVMNGWEFLEAKTKMPGLAEVPVVVISATDPGPSVASRTVGFLRKPTELDDLLRLVKRFSA
jgi:CheY-like chemotaxis protein